MNKPERQERRFFTAAEKLAALKRHVLEKVPVSDLCDDLGIAPNLIDRWQKELFENGAGAFDNGRKARSLEGVKDRKVEFLEAIRQRKN